MVPDPARGPLARRSPRLVLCAVVVALVAAFGLGTTALGAGAATAPAGYTTTPIKTAGVAIAVPDTWLKVDPTSAASATALQQAAQANPNLVGLMTQYEKIKSSIKYWVINSEATTFADNLLVLPIPVPASMLQSPSQVKQVLQSSLGSSVDTLTVAKTKVDRKPALEARATLSVTGVDGTPTTAHATILLMKTKRGVMDLDYTSSTPPDSDATWKAMRASIDIT